MWLKKRKAVRSRRRARHEKAVEARRAAARRARRKFVRMSQKNDYILTERYRTAIRKERIESDRANIAHIVRVAADIDALKESRCAVFRQLINASVSTMTEQLRRILAKIDAIFARHVPPVVVDVEESQRLTRDHSESLYRLFRSEFRFDVSAESMLRRLFGTDDGSTVASAPKFSALAKEGAKAVQARQQADAEHRKMRSALETQRVNLIAIIEQEEIKTIASEQILQEDIEKCEAEIGELQTQIDAVQIMS